MSRQHYFAAKLRIREYRMLEVYHPAIGTVRYVNGRLDPLTATLELSAPRNAGQLVTFLGGAFEFQKPDQQSATVRADIQLGNVGQQIKQQLKAIKGAARAKTGEVIYREYLGNNLGAPEFVLRLFITGISLTAQGALIRAEQDNPSDRQIAEFYTSERFPGLAESL
ncbi:DUF1833 family protein [Alishewanella sp. d11]|uniref:DUF1833 family protein n=1 Tax=Alishewanella sp. d11 TaxID=3414030 RepID=UPI003BF795B8